MISWKDSERTELSRATCTLASEGSAGTLSQSESPGSSDALARTCYGKIGCVPTLQLTIGCVTRRRCSLDSMVPQVPEDWIFVCGAQRAHKESGKVVTLPLVFPYGSD